jgi:outer membrane protein assembly factor BamB
MLVSAPNQLVYLCNDQRLRSMIEGKEAWSLPTGRIYSNLLADAAGTIYYGDSGKNGESHLHALSARGERLWSVDAMAAVHYITLDGKGRLLVSESGIRGLLQCFQD